jgi:hypothetical protein
MDDDGAKLRLVWNQRETPVILRRTGKGEDIRLRLPTANASRDHMIHRSWIRNGRRSAVAWSQTMRCWEAPRSWFNDLVERCLDQFGKVYIIQPFREQEKCAPACMNASGHECQCSCMGANHGTGNDGSWFEVSDTFATRWGDLQLACRLMERRKR